MCVCVCIHTHGYIMPGQLFSLFLCDCFHADFWGNLDMGKSSELFFNLFYEYLWF